MSLGEKRECYLCTFQPIKAIKVTFYTALNLDMWSLRSLSSCRVVGSNPVCVLVHHFGTTEACDVIKDFLPFWRSRSFKGSILDLGSFFLQIAF